MKLLILTAIRLYRDVLAEALAKLPRVEVVEAAAPGSQALARARVMCPDVVLMDSESAAAPDMVASVMSACPKSHVVAIGITENDDDIVACAEAGVSGLVSQDATVESLVAACACAMRGEVLCSPRVAGVVMRRCHFLATTGDRRAPSDRTDLSQRELEVIALLDVGFSNKEIASQLCIEVATVKNHVHSILGKLQVGRRQDVAAAIRSDAYPASSRLRGLIHLRNANE
jgi:DNA-binding NarL/FixJ family response regulator